MLKNTMLDNKIVGSGKKLVAIAGWVLEQCFRVKPEETVLVVTDGGVPGVANAFWEAARERVQEVLLLRFEPRPEHGCEPPAGVAAAMKASDVVLLPTIKSLTHTRARREACAAGARIASMPMITEEIMQRALDVDYEKLKRTTYICADLLGKGQVLRVTAPNGTDLTLDLGGRQGVVDTGELWQKGSCSNLPAGEACIAPVEGSARGIVVLDGSLAGWGKLEEPVRLRVEEGYVTGVEGGKAADWLRETLEKYGALSGNIAELGIGTNEKAVVTGNILKDEKVLGTVHIGLGDNKALGGKVEAGIHLDGVILNPSVEIDGRLVIVEGQLMITI